MIILKPIKPAKPFQSSIFRDEIDRAAQAVGEKIFKDFTKTTATWRRKPRFDARIRRGRAAGGVSIQVDTRDEIYGYVDLGTRKHIIRPRRKKALAFKKGGRPKTKVRVIGSTAGSPGTTPVVADHVHHPGTKARKFSAEIKKRWQPKFRTEMAAAMGRAAKRSGHAAK